MPRSIKNANLTKMSLWVWRDDWTKVPLGTRLELRKERLLPFLDLELWAGRHSGCCNE